MSNSMNTDDTAPPTMGAAMRFMTSAPMIGGSPAIMTEAVIILGRTR